MILPCQNASRCHMSHASQEVQGSMTLLCLSPFLLLLPRHSVAKNSNRHFTVNIYNICNYVYILYAHGNICCRLLIYVDVNYTTLSHGWFIRNLLWRVFWWTSPTKTPFCHDGNAVTVDLFTVQKYSLWKYCQSVTNLNVGNQNGSQGYSYPNRMTGQDFSVACSSRKTNCTLVSSTNISMTWSNGKNKVWCFSPSQAISLGPQKDSMSSNDFCLRDREAKTECKWLLVDTVITFQLQYFQLVIRYSLSLSFFFRRSNVLSDSWLHVTTSICDKLLLYLIDCKDIQWKVKIN